VAAAILRGGGGKPNYDSVNVSLAEQALDKADLAQNIMIDCSHENSSKNPALQPLVMDNVTNQILEGNQSIIGLMVESNLKHGRQNIPANLDDLEYGLSVTDGCISWEETETALLTMRDKLKDVLPGRNQ
jgi:3-deoxy-7-phosphoheptulonate synthase